MTGNKVISDAEIEAALNVTHDIGDEIVTLEQLVDRHFSGADVGKVLVRAALEAAAEARAAKAVEVLRDFEWSGTKNTEDGAYPCCPECQRLQYAAQGAYHWHERTGGQHDEGCAFATLLSDHPAPEPGVEAETPTEAAIRKTLSEHQAHYEQHRREQIRALQTPADGGRDGK